MFLGLLNVIFISEKYTSSGADPDKDILNNSLDGSIEPLNGKFPD